jgi:4-amino-4-deoxy-L-arabinose transferase-like glycosyltransferase
MAANPRASGRTVIVLSLEPLRRRALSNLTWLRGHWPEALALLVVLGVCVGVRVVKLGEIPRIITGDEAENLQSAYRIMKGTGGGLFAFDWKPAPILGLYPLAWSVELFGNSVSDFRMYPVIFSLLTIVVTYVLARESMGSPAALLAMALFGTNLWFLHFSRTAWDNMNAAFLAAGACWATMRALQTQRWGWWAVVGLFITGSLYGYFSARFIVISVGLVCGLAVLLRQAPWRRTALGFGAACVLAAILFAPMAEHILDDWAYFNNRTNNVSVFSVKEPYEGDTNSWTIVWKNLHRNYSGFVLQDGAQMQRGLWGRYNPERRAPLDFVSGHLFWGGLIVGAFFWRRTYAWWPFFIPLGLAEVFSLGTPDLARGIVFAPFYFLFIGILFDWLLRIARQPLVRNGFVAGLAVVVIAVGVYNVREYFDWQAQRTTKEERLPGVDRCEFSLFSSMAQAAAEKKEHYDTAAFEEARRELDCSPVLRAIREREAQQTQ